MFIKVILFVRAKFVYGVVNFSYFIKQLYNGPDCSHPQCLQTSVPRYNGAWCGPQVTASPGAQVSVITLRLLALSTIWRPSHDGLVHCVNNTYEFVRNLLFQFIIIVVRPGVYFKVKRWNILNVINLVLMNCI